MINFYYSSNKLFFPFILLLAFPTGLSFATVYIVSDSGGDFTIIQNALNVAVAGDTILVREKVSPYIEELQFPNSGDSVNGYITLMAYEGEHPIIDGTGLDGGSGWPQGLIKILNKNYIRIIGFEIRNLITWNGSKFPAGIWVRGSSHHIQIINNNVHHIEQNANNAGAHGIAVYGTDGSSSINNILIEGNEVHDSKLGWSESLVLNGNVENFIVRNNIVHDNDNIAYDFIGFEGVSPNPDFDQARNGLVVDNVAYNIDSRGNPAYGGDASADGFYVDGGKDIIIERNTVYNSNIGIEIASEHGGKTTSGIIVRNNLIRDNIVLGLAIGGYDQNRGSAKNCVIVNNTFYKNNYENFDWGAEILIQYYSDNNIFKNNIIYSLPGNPLIEHTTGTGSENIFNNNIYFTDGNAIWYWGSNMYSQFDDYKTGSGQDINSLFDDPELFNPSNNNPSLSGTSPAIDKGQNLVDSLIGETDYFGNTRIVNGQVDIGAAEYAIVNSFNDKSDVLPNEFYLYPVYPNPFNPSTTFSFNVPTNLTGTPIELFIFNTTGEEIDMIEFENLSAGINYYKWDYRSRKGISLSSGVYLAVLKSDNLMKTTKIVLLK